MRIKRIFQRMRAPGAAFILRISVEDTGAGIETESLPTLFDAFVRTDSVARRNIHGTGLGLTIAKELTQQMGGEIFVTSQLEVGSRFWVELPQRIENYTPMGDWQVYAQQYAESPARTPALRRRRAFWPWMTVRRTCRRCKHGCAIRRYSLLVCAGENRRRMHARRLAMTLC